MIPIEVFAKKVLSVAVSASEKDVDYLKFKNLCFYVYAWYHTFFGEPIISGQFMAEERGAVHPGIKKIFFDTYGANALVTKKDLKKDKSEDETLYDNIERFNRCADEVVTHLSRYTGSELSDKTHCEDAWFDADVRSQFSGKIEPIPNSDIVECYKKHPDYRALYPKVVVNEYIYTKVIINNFYVHTIPMKQDEGQLFWPVLSRLLLKHNYEKMKFFPFVVNNEEYEYILMKGRILVVIDSEARKYLMSPVKKIIDDIRIEINKSELDIMWAKISDNPTDLHYSIGDINLYIFKSDISAIRTYVERFISEMDKHRQQVFPYKKGGELSKSERLIKYLNELRNVSHDDFIKFLKLDEVCDLRVFDCEEFDTNVIED